MVSGLFSLALWRKQRGCVVGAAVPVIRMPACMKVQRVPLLNRHRVATAAEEPAVGDKRYSISHGQSARNGVDCSDERLYIVRFIDKFYGYIPR